MADDQEKIYHKSILANPQAKYPARIVANRGEARPLIAPYFPIADSTQYLDILFVVGDAGKGSRPD
jgi:hypothetical protein